MPSDKAQDQGAAKAPPDKASIVERLVDNLTRAAALRRTAHASPVTGDARMALRGWQSRRLARTHVELLGSPRYGDAATFFLTDLYGPVDLNARDAGVKRVVPIMARFLTYNGLATVADTVELDALSEDLDCAIVELLGADILTMTGPQYGAAYRAVGRRADRERQLNLIRHLGTSLDRLTREPLISTALKMMRKPALLAGLGDLQNFLERGYSSFKKMNGASEFLDMILTREWQMLESVFAGDDTMLGD